MINLNNETGQLIYCDWGKDKILLMRGDSAFIKRTINLCHNYSIGITNTIHKFFDNSSYIITTESKLLSGLNDYFVAEIIFDKVNDTKYLTALGLVIWGNSFLAKRSNKGGIGNLGNILDNANKK